MQNVMVDLETLGLRPGNVILSIGAVGFDKSGVGQEFYVEINQLSCVLRGLTIDEATQQWWSQQNDIAKGVLLRTQLDQGSSLESSLDQFAQWLQNNAPADVCVWGNGAAFDNAMLAETYKLCGKRVPWSYSRDRCYRTLRSLFSDIEAGVITKGVAHNALDDARYQAEHAVDILRAIGKSHVGT